MVVNEEDACWNSIGRERRKKKFWTEHVRLNYSILYIYWMPRKRKLYIVYPVSNSPIHVDITDILMQPTKICLSIPYK